MKSGKSTQVYRPIPTNPPFSSGTRVFTATNVAAGAPRRRPTGQIAPSAKSVGARLTTVHGQTAMNRAGPSVMIEVIGSHSV